MPGRQIFNERKITMDKNQILEAIEQMSVLELNELVEACEEKFGVSAAAPVAVAGAVADGGEAGGGQTLSRRRRSGPCPAIEDRKSVV